MATPNLCHVVTVYLDEIKKIYLPIKGNFVNQSKYEDLPVSMKNGVLRHVADWSNFNEIHDYFENLNPIASFCEMADINNKLFQQQ
jgi:hypothetical protein